MAGRLFLACRQAQDCITQGPSLHVCLGQGDSEMKGK